ncbi:MAG: hypothetical protein MUF21_14460 [Gemmatimonadaceae bacterium]|nr:hypothetical protein [Gemmatimonadaceae bacterium]
MTTTADSLLARFRTWALLLLALSLAGTLVELLLIGHWDGWQQWVPLGLLGSSLVTVLAFLVRPWRALLPVVRTLCVALALAGAAGSWLHFDGNAEFERESVPDIGGRALFTAAITGATPVLAPGSLLTFALLGLLALHRHPVGARD